MFTVCRISVNVNVTVSITALVHDVNFPTRRLQSAQVENRNMREILPLSQPNCCLSAAQA